MSTSETRRPGAQAAGEHRQVGPRLVLGQRLRRLREAASITTGQAAVVIRGSHSKISRMEHGRVACKERDVEDLLTFYGVTEGQEREGLLVLAREASPAGWWHEYSDILPSWVEPYFGLEAAASFIRTWELQFVPGLLQTEAYAQAIIRLGDAPTDEDVQRRAEARLARQGILGLDSPFRLWAVIDEGALRRPIGGKAVMREQLRHLLTMTQHPAVTLQVMSFRTDEHPALGGPFTILRFAEPDLRDVVYMEQLTGAMYLDKPTDVDDYLQVMERLCLQAESADQTRELLEDVLAGLYAGS
jgi:transcriptional regulator with XRE-family HTH domain